jgi:phage tail sheath gpL-like
LHYSPPVPRCFSYGQGSNAASVAGLLAAQMHNDPMFPVDAVVTPAGSATIVLTARDQGTDGNSYNIAIAGQTSQPSSFTTPSFPAVSVTLANGANPVPSFTPGTVLITTYTTSVRLKV